MLGVAGIALILAGFCIFLTSRVTETFIDGVWVLGFCLILAQFVKGVKILRHSRRKARRHHALVRYSASACQEGLPEAHECQTAADSRNFV
jgi:hypothetical protein